MYTDTYTYSTCTDVNENIMLARVPSYLRRYFRKYFRTSEVLSYLRTKVLCTKVLSYLRTRVLSYLRTKVLSKVRRYFRTVRFFEVSSEIKPSDFVTVPQIEVKTTLEDSDLHEIPSERRKHSQPQVHVVESLSRSHKTV